MDLYSYSLMPSFWIRAQLNVNIEVLFHFLHVHVFHRPNLTLKTYFEICIFIHPFERRTYYGMTMSIHLWALKQLFQMY